MTTSNTPWILGLSASHNGSACLLRGDEIIVAIQEERLSRSKRHRFWASEPALCISYCLDAAGITAADLSAVGLSTQGRLQDPRNDISRNPLLSVWRNGTSVFPLSHHAAHAYSAFATSGFDDSVVLVVDGIGSPVSDLADAERAISGQGTDAWETISLYRASRATITPLEKHVAANRRIYEHKEEFGLPSFGSLGGMFQAGSKAIFNEIMEAGKVMGLAPYGTVTYPPESFFTIRDGQFVFNDQFAKDYPAYEPWPNSQDKHQNLAASMQAALEDALLYLARRGRSLAPGVERLCMAGGVALNSVANERIVREVGFEDVYIIPAAEDSGASIGAAYYAYQKVTGRSASRRLKHDSVGRIYAGADFDKAVAECPSVTVETRTDILQRTVDLLADGKILGWFQAGSEIGPRALGQRSILCDPRRPDGKQVLNERVKHREGFRPFAPALPLEVAREWFDFPDGVPSESPAMLRVAPFRADKAPLVPAVVHVDGTGRLQTLTRDANGLFYDLVVAFGKRTGVPILLNTSFNVMGEPIVETPEDALWALLYTGLDAVVLGDRIVVRAPGFESVLDLYPVVAAPAHRFEFKNDVESGRADVDASGIAFEVDTPWGRAERRIEERNFGQSTLDLFHAIDGATSGRQLAAALNLGERDVIRQLGMLRRARVIRCLQEPLSAE